MVWAAAIVTKPAQPYSKLVSHSKINLRYISKDADNNRILKPKIPKYFLDHSLIMLVL